MKFAVFNIFIYGVIYIGNIYSVNKRKKIFTKQY